MEFVTLLLSGHLILIFVTAFSPDENLKTEFSTAIDKYADGFDLSLDIQPRYYVIELELDIEKDVFHGTCHVGIDIFNVTRNIRLHSANLNIIDSVLTCNRKKKHLQSLSYIYTKKIISLYFNEALSPAYNPCYINITFTGVISNMGNIININKMDRFWLIAKHNSGNGTRRLFPCWDEPRFKANFTISLKYHKNYTAFSNMEFVSTRYEKDMMVTGFSTTPAIATYLITMGLMRLPNSNINFMGYKLSGRWDEGGRVTEHLKYAAGTIENFTQAFENEWPYLKDYLSKQYIAIPGWLDDGMDKWQIVLYREANVICNEKKDPIGRKIEISRLIARKVAGQLIGSVITSSQWSHLWLHEGISTLLGINILNKIVPDFRMMDLFVVQTLQESLRLDVNTFMKSLTSEINNISLFSFAYYLKGSVILHMFQHVLGNKVLQEGIDIYMKMQPSSPDSFWNAMEAAYNNKATEDLEVFNIRRAMNSWLNQSHYPILNVERFEDREIVTISTQNTSDIWWIPVTYNMQTQINFNNTLDQFWIRSYLSLSYDKPIKRVISTPNLKANWIIFNLQQTGYYRVNYCKEGWRTITNYLSSKDYTKVHVLNRAQVIDDAFYFMITHQLNSSIFWELTNFLSKETDYIVWYPMFKAIEYMSCSYPFHENQQFKAKILQLLVPVLEQIEYLDLNHESHLTKCLRQEAIRWAYVLGDDKCKFIANLVLKLRLPTLINSSLPWRKETYCNGLSIADDATVDEIFNIYLVTDSNTRILEFLACSDSYLHIISILMDMEKLKPRNKNSSYTERSQNMIKRDYINMFHHIVQRHAKNELALQYILSGWKYIKPKEITLTAALIDIINHIYTTNHLDKIKEFMKNLEKETPTVLLNHTFFELSPLNTLIINKINKEGNIKALSSRIKSKINIRLSQINGHMDSFIFIDNM